MVSTSIMTAAAAAVDLQPSPITPNWILSGTPEARNKLLATSEDRTASIMVWECTPGLFEWHYSEDETVVVISGEVFITNEEGGDCRLGPGDVAFFPAGCSSTWRVTNTVRKVAFLRNALPLPLSLSLRAWNKLLLIFGLRGRAPLMLPLLLYPVGFLIGGFQ